jgi:hypothetical protein
MANIKISDLTAASAAADANEFEINESGTSKKVTGSQIKAYVNAGDGALAAKDTVATADIDDLAVTTGKLAADAVDGTKIADDAIGNEHIATDAVNADSIAANAVGASELNVPGNGTSGQYLASDGDGTMTWTTLPVAAGGFANMQVFTSPGTWTNPGNITKVKVTVTGGGGGVSSSWTDGSPGGAAGGTAIEVIPFPSGTNVPVTVGAGGNGNPGGTSSFGAYCSASGGTKNQSYGTGGVGSGGGINIYGGDVINGAQPGQIGGSGAASFWGSGGQGGRYQNTPATRVGIPGKAYGSGAGGNGYSPAGNISGAGGVVVVEY